MKFKPQLTTQIVISGLLVGLAAVLALLSFRIGSGTVYLVGIPLFLLPLFVRWQFAVLATLIGAVLADLITGYLIYTWISMLAYGAAILTLLISRLKLHRLLYLGLVLVALAEILAIYFFLEWAVLGFELALADLIATAVQSAIVAPAVFVLYWPSHLIQRTLLP